ncbi:MAG: TolC family protein [Tannerellaceae bacterium]
MKSNLIILFLYLSIASALGQQNINRLEAETIATSEYMNNDSLQAMLGKYELVKLPPLSVFLKSVYEHPSIQMFEAYRDEEQAVLKDTQKKWLNYFRITGQYQYGYAMGLSSTSTADDPMYYTYKGSNQNMYNFGAALSIPIGDLLGQRQKVRAQKARLRQKEYEYEISIEERKLKILEAYNQVLQSLSTLKAKSDAAALYNAQMKISEQDFINGKISIIDLSLERSRRSTAVVSYQEGRATLHNAITLLEMLTNVKIINN